MSYSVLLNIIENPSFVGSIVTKWCFREKRGTRKQKLKHVCCVTMVADRFCFFFISLSRENAWINLIIELGYYLLHIIIISSERPKIQWESGTKREIPSLTRSFQTIVAYHHYRRRCRCHRSIAVLVVVFVVSVLFTYC